MQIRELDTMDSEIALQMTISDEIHHSVADADDLEEVWDREIAVGDVFRNLLHHPLQLITRWNWKSAFLAAIVRSTFYFTVYKASKESWAVTLTAVGIELAFRFLTTGVAGAIVQSFRRATPEWVATAIISISLPAITHLIEFFTHYVQEKYYADIFAPSANNARQKTFAISVLFSVVSAMFNLYLMRRGVLLVGAGEETQTLRNDFKKIPFMISEFIKILPLLIIQLIREKKILQAFGVFASFGLSVGTILGVFRGFDWNWFRWSAYGAWGT
ncbi:MAG TPA: hypothetical protein VHQ01_09115, partial [Pyrinomonadaceae bacterium]|nr:hypothetical protein [Pyrinomonadaceae bacterium]